MSWGIVFRASQYFKNSLWIVPFVGAMVGVVLAEAGLLLDAGGVLPAHTYSAETATAVLTAAIGAAASLTGFVITVTVLGVSRRWTPSRGSTRRPATLGVPEVARRRHRRRRSGVRRRVNRSRVCSGRPTLTRQVARLPRRVAGP